MKHVNKYAILIVLTAIVIVWGGIRSECPCGNPVSYPFAFLGSIFGCGGEKAAETVKPTVSDLQTVNPVVASADNNTDKKNDSKGIKVTFIEIGSVKCIPCKMMQPIMRQVEEKYKGQVKVVFYDVWTPAGKPYAKQYGIRGIPAQVFLDKDGKEYSRHVGFFPFEELEKVLKTGGVR